jgi:zinc transport system substrate-binding protein
MQLSLKRTSTILAFAVKALTFAVPLHAAGPEVVASIPPIHSLVSGVMKGVGSPHLLIGGGRSPHAYSLRPSDARALNRADVIFWVGEGVESFLVKPLGSLGENATIIELVSVEGIDLLPARAGGAWDRHGHGQKTNDQDVHDHPKHADHDFDSHVWLGPNNAKAIVAAIVSALDNADPDHSVQYRENGQLLMEQLDALSIELSELVHPVAHLGFIVFHDAFQYFEQEFELIPVGTISISPDRLPGARRVGELRDKIKRLEALCVFKEPQFTPKLAESIIEGTRARLGTLDPVGADLAPGPELYFDLMRRNTRSLVTCLTAAIDG